MAAVRHLGKVAPGLEGRLDRRRLLSVAASAGAAAVASGAGLGAVAAPAEAGEVTTFVPAMALISVPAGVLSVQQRQAMVAGVTRVLADAARVELVGLPFVSVLVVEAADGGWGVAGYGYVRSELPELVAGRPLLPGSAPAGVR